MMLIKKLYLNIFPFGIIFLINFCFSFEFKVQVGSMFATTDNSPISSQTLFTNDINLGGYYFTSDINFYFEDFAFGLGFDHQIPNKFTIQDPSMYDYSKITLLSPFIKYKFIFLQSRYMLSSFNQIILKDTDLFLYYNEFIAGWYFLKESITDSLGENSDGPSNAEIFVGLSYTDWIYNQKEEKSAIGLYVDLIVYSFYDTLGLEVIFTINQLHIYAGFSVILNFEANIDDY